jgi:hypothetical protein
MVNLPTYYRWVFKPEDASVELSHNGEDHPAWVRYHTDLKDGDSHHGYAYRIGGGWRLTDWEHKPLDDPYVVSSVLRKLRSEEGYHNPHRHLDDWTQFEEPSFEEFHYGLPKGIPNLDAPTPA